MGGALGGLIHFGLHDQVLPLFGLSTGDHYRASYGLTAALLCCGFLSPNMMMRALFLGLVVGEFKYRIEQPQNGFYIQQPGLSDEEIINQK